MSKGQKLLVRAVIFSVVIALLLWYERPSAANGWPVRPATVDEWQQSVQELATAKIGKSLPYRPIVIHGASAPGIEQVRAGGHLIWWQSEVGESLTYLPIAGETPTTGTALLSGLQRGTVLLPAFPDLRQRLSEMLHMTALPSGWSVITEPETKGP